jgi:hypothetical protein
MAKKETEKKMFDPEKALTKAMTDLESALNTMTEKVKAKREELEKKGLEQTVNDTVDKVKVGSKAIGEQIQEDTKKLRKNIEDMLNEL